MLSKRIVANHLRPGRLAGRAAVLAGLLAVSPQCLRAMDEVRIAFIEADDGFTRESIPVLSRPDAHPTPAATPAPAAAATPASAAGDTPAPPQHSSHNLHHPRVVAHGRRHHWRHRQQIARAEPSPAPSQTARRRNWLVRFVVWWNGFADRRFNGVGHVPLHDA